jgi:ABC-type Fe3+/spermidine/putrescine transport system ATPase subunit
MYTLKNVIKSYGVVEAIKGISCNIPTDQFVCIMGASGSGKSTLLRLLSFVETSDQGSIQLVLQGEEFDSMQSPRPWPQVTCVFQKQFLWPHLSLRQNISLPLELKDTSDAEERIEKAIDLFGMSSFVDRYPNEVSGGQAQRVALARALVLNPKLILIDEAHGGLDVGQQEILNAHLLKLRDSGVGLIVVTHSLEFAEKYADMIIHLEEGSLTEKISNV